MAGSRIPGPEGVTPREAGLADDDWLPRAPRATPQPVGCTPGDTGIEEWLQPPAFDPLALPVPVSADPAPSAAARPPGAPKPPGTPPARPGLGESMIKPGQRSGLNVDLAVQEHRQKTDFRQGSGRDVQSAHMVNSSSMRDIADYVRGRALTVLMDRDLHRAFDDYWKNWARQRIASAKPGADLRVTVAEWERVLNDAADSVPGLRGRTADTMSFLIRTELYQTLGLKPDQLIRLPYS